MMQQVASGPRDPASGVERARVGDLEIAFRSTGSGPPVVLLHGLAEDGTSWDAVAGRLAGAGFRCLAIDWRGHGATAAGRGEGSVAQLAADLAGFLAAVTGPAACVGFSLGGVIVLEAALARPDLVRQAVVVGTSSKVGRAAAGFFAERIAQLETDPAAFRAGLTGDTAAQILCNREAAAAVAARRLAAVGDGAGYANAARAMLALAEHPMTERLRDIRVPVHIIQGAGDAFCPPRAAAILREAMPQAGHAEIPQAGHLMTVDQPDRLAQEIAQALQCRQTSGEPT